MVGLEVGESLESMGGRTDGIADSPGYEGGCNLEMMVWIVLVPGTGHLGYVPARTSGVERIGSDNSNKVGGVGIRIDCVCVMR